MKGKNPEDLYKTPDDELQKMLLAKARNSSSNQDSNLHSLEAGWKADAITITPHVAPSIGGRLGKQTR